jgi:hypothetical protein
MNPEANPMPLVSDCDPRGRVRMPMLLDGIPRAHAHD